MARSPSSRVGLFEEYLSRGFLQFTLTRGVFGLAEKISSPHARAFAFRIAAFFMSLFFSAGHLHNARENPMGIVMTFLAAIVFSYALWRTGSLWWAIGFHMAWDWAQSFLYGVPDSGQISAGRLFHTHPTGNPLLSGGIDGPEGSVYVIPILSARRSSSSASPPNPAPSLPWSPTSTRLAPRTKRLPHVRFWNMGLQNAHPLIPRRLSQRSRPHAQGLKSL